MQFQTSKKVGGQGEKVQAIKKLASFFNTARQAFCRFKPKGFDSRKAKVSTELTEGGTKTVVFYILSQNS